MGTEAHPYSTVGAYEQVEPQRVPEEHGRLRAEEARGPEEITLDQAGDHGQECHAAAPQLPQGEIEKRHSPQGEQGIEGAEGEHGVVSQLEHQRSGVEKGGQLGSQEVAIGQLPGTDAPGSIEVTPLVVVGKPLGNAVQVVDGSQDEQSQGHEVGATLCGRPRQ